MANPQTNLRLAPETLEAAKEAAKTRGIPLNEYVERLITEDVSGVRGRGMAAAQRIIEDFGSFLDGLEQELDQRAPRSSGSAAA
ncbi:toxin-antitoxin system HicB family antitoxin [Actinacidiphila oryziradicis]|jgi:hypothetical protein|uniref:Toxin-antitoxin system HicB family antitoxin n=1 Tax=Actinacidiphila oryziradicis TaxID=2571141 RepID=A0A4U0RXP8_9ACTN|nr:toxin-antitoxin system HicB family antitoxin [Actinacidiphila oryziradicis]TJZ99600.1 toxin-antitoxin system HicB family antitoxin [Actinacidiphila oryziradicis]